MSPGRIVDGIAQTLGAIVMQAVAFVEQLRAGGATREQSERSLEKVLREVWPKPKDRTEPWRYECEDCGDTGLRMLQCTPKNRCDGISTRTDSPGDRPGKYKRLCVSHATYEHDYGVPCFCRKGDLFRPRPLREQQADEFVAAAKSKPKPAFSRFGR